MAQSIHGRNFLATSPKRNGAVHGRMSSPYLTVVLRKGDSSTHRSVSRVDRTGLIDSTRSFAPREEEKRCPVVARMSATEVRAMTGQASYTNRNAAARR